MEELQSWWEVPSIAHFCSLFREAFSLVDFDIEHLEDAFINYDGENQLVLELICRLLAGCYGRKEISSEQTEQYLKDIINARYVEEGKENPLAGEITYAQLPLRTKVEVLYNLTEYRLDAEDVLDELKGLESDGMRLESFGEDARGSIYWYFYGTRLYREEPPPAPPPKPKPPKKSVRKTRQRGRKKKETPAKVKKKPGRPPKNAKLQTPEPEKVRPRPGRPRRAPVRLLEQESSDSGVSDVPVKAPVKRKRGRPKRVVDKCEQVKEESDEANESDAKSEVKPQVEGSRRRSSRVKMAVLKKCEEEESSEESSIESESSDDETEEEEMEMEPPRPTVLNPDGSVRRWFVQCSTKEDWEALAESFKGSKAKCERELYKSITEDFMPELSKLFEDKEKEYQKKLLEFQPPRKSSRIESKQAKQAETEKLLKSYEEEEAKFKRENDKEVEERRRLLWEAQREEKEKRQQAERLKLKEERARRAHLREERAQLIAEGKEIPPELMSTPDWGFVRRRRGSNDSVRTNELDEDIYLGLFKAFDQVKKHDDAWLFAEPVKEEFAPGYFDIITEPMDFTIIERKLTEREYSSKEEFVGDFKQMFKNCNNYNGSDSVCSDMAKRIKMCLQRAMRKYLPKEEPKELSEPKEDKDDKEYRSNAKVSAQKFRPKREASTKALERLQEFVSKEQLQEVTSNEFYRKYIKREEASAESVIDPLLKTLNSVDPDGRNMEQLVGADSMAVPPKPVACYNRKRIKVVDNNIKMHTSEPLKHRILAQYGAQNGDSNNSDDKLESSVPNGVTKSQSTAPLKRESSPSSAQVKKESSSGSETPTSQSSKSPVSRQYTVQTPYGSTIRFSKPKSSITAPRTTTTRRISVGSTSAAKMAVQQSQQTQVHSIRMTGPQLTAFLQQNPGLQSRIIVQQTASGMATVVQPTTTGVKPPYVPTSDGAALLNSIMNSNSLADNSNAQEQNIMPVPSTVDLSLQRVIASIQSHALSQSRLVATGSQSQNVHADGIPQGASREIETNFDGGLSASSSRSSTPNALREDSNSSQPGFIGALQMSSPPNPTQATVHHHPPVSNQSNSEGHVAHGSMSAAKLLTISRASADSKHVSQTIGGATIVSLPVSNMASKQMNSGPNSMTRLVGKSGTISYLPTSSVDNASSTISNSYSTSDNNSFLNEYLNYAQGGALNINLKRAASGNILSPSTAKILRQNMPATVTALSAAPRLPTVGLSSAEMLSQSVNNLDAVVAGLEDGETDTSIDDQNFSNYLADIGENSADSGGVRDDILGQALSLSEIEPMSPLDGNEFASLDASDLGANTAPLLDSIQTNSLGLGQQTNFNSVITSVSQPATVLGSDLRLIQGANGTIVVSTAGQVISNQGQVTMSLPQIAQPRLQQPYVLSGQLPSVATIQQLQHVMNAGAVQISQAIPHGTIIQSVATPVSSVPVVQPITQQSPVQIVTNSGHVQQSVQMANLANDNPAVQTLLQNAQSVTNAQGMNVRHVTISPDMYQHLFGQQLQQQQQAQSQFMTPGGLVSSKLMPGAPTSIVPAGYQIVQNGATAALQNYGMHQRPSGP